MARLKEKYVSEVVPELQKVLGLQNRMQIPRLLKIVVNMGMSADVDKETFKNLAEDLALITGQRHAVCTARKSVSNFKLREGMPIGAKVTLRGVRMYEFLDRLVNAVLPGIRDFRGVSRTGFDGRGNYCLGIQEQTIFPEIDPDKVKVPQGMDIAIVTSARSDEEAFELLRLMGMPFSGN